MSEWFFETPWWLPTFIAGVGAVLLWSGNNRRDRKLLRYGFSLLAAAILLSLISYFVDTEKEKAVRQTDRLIASINKQDWKTFRSILSPDASFALYDNADQITDAARRGVTEWSVNSIRIFHQRVTQNADQITVEIDTLAFVQKDQPVRSTWSFDFEQSGKQRLLYRITPISIEGRGQEAVIPRLPRPK